MRLSEKMRSRTAERLRLLYGDAAETVMRRIDALVEKYASLPRRVGESLWDERSIVLITYGDQVHSEGRPSLESLKQFLDENAFGELISGIHILPFFPSSSDDGFSIIDYRRVDPPLGDWNDVARLGESYRLMFDFVVNHCSQQHDWFGRYLQGEEPYTSYFIDVDPATDLSQVTRPRSTPLLTPLETDRGTKHVWTTFSADQVDLNLSCPDVLIEMLDILLYYVQRGARMIRLDAIGFLWKKIGTTCMHLPETHLCVKLMRDVLDDVAPGTILITETNVPHEENVSYFGAGDEAHAVYQFSLAPLLLDAFLTGEAGPLNHWLAGLEYPSQAMTFFNFTASHDGVGVRPLEGLLGPERVEALVESVGLRGGVVSTRRKRDGSDSPYELNITYFSALDTPEGLPPEAHARKFLTSQGLMLALRGIPGIYFHSLVGTPNYHEGVQATGNNRTINRRKFEIGELREILSDKNSAQRRVFDGYRKMLAVRRSQPAFHPDAEQSVVETGHRSVVAFRRESLDGDQQILVVANVDHKPVQLDLSASVDIRVTRDLLSGSTIDGKTFEIRGHDIAWLV